MATPGLPSLGLSGRNWLTSMEYQSLYNGQSPTSPQTPSTPGSQTLGFPVHDREDWYEMISCVHLESKGGGVGQGIILCLSMNQDENRFANALEISTYPALVLLTNHHIIPTLEQVPNWKLLISGSTFNLKETNFQSCKSCCGPYGVWKSPEHSGKAKSCPFQMDFTLLPLSNAFANEIMKKKELFFPVVMPLNVESLERALQSQRFYTYQRNKKTGHMIPSDFKIQTPTKVPTTEDAKHLNGRVVAYREMCVLKYRCPHIKDGSSGAGIFFEQGDERVLLGLHVSTEKDGNDRFGTSIHAIFHAIADGERCDLAPYVSLLKEAKFHKCLAEEWYEKLRRCLETVKPKGIPAVPIQATEPEGETQQQDLSLSTLLEILHCLLHEKIVVIERNNPLCLPSINLLATAFNCFGRFGGVSKTAAEIEKVFNDERQRSDFYKLVKEAIEQAYAILDSKPEVAVLESCFDFWHKTRLFPLPEPILFTDPGKFGKLKAIRDCHHSNSKIQQSFGDICLEYQLHLRTDFQRQSEAREAEFEKQREAREAECKEELKQQREGLEREKEEFKETVLGQLRQREEQLEGQIREMEEQFRQLQAQVEEEKRTIEELGQTLEDKERLLTQREQVGVERELAIQQLNSRVSSLNVENEQQAREITRLKQRVVDLEQANSSLLNHQARFSSHQARSNSQSSGTENPPLGLYPKRMSQQSFSSESDSYDFWGRDMYDLLKRDVTLRTEIGSYFEKTDANEAPHTWEHLVSLLEEKQLLQMTVEGLESKAVGEIIVAIVSAWRRKERVTIRRFCEISNELGITVMQDVLESADSARNSVSQDV